MYLFILLGLILIIVFVHSYKSNTSKPLPIVYSENSIAKVNNIYYKTLQQAIDKASQGDYIELLNNVYENIIISNKQLTINGNNYEIKGLKTTTLLSNNQLVSSLSIMNSTIDLNDLIINPLNKSFYNIGVYISNSNVTINNVTIEKLLHSYRDSPLTYGIYVYNDKSHLYFVSRNIVINDINHYGIYINNKTDDSFNFSLLDSLLISINKNNPNINFIYLNGLLESHVSSCVFKSSKSNKIIAPIYVNNQLSNTLLEHNEYLNE